MTVSRPVVTIIVEWIQPAAAVCQQAEEWMRMSKPRRSTASRVPTQT